MLIKDIRFRRIRKLAKKNSKNKDLWEGVPAVGNALGTAFNWGLSPERYLFWACINGNAYEEAFKLRPSLFKPTKKEFKEAYKMHEIHEQYRLMRRYPG